MHTSASSSLSSPTSLAHNDRPSPSWPFLAKSGSETSPAILSPSSDIDRSLGASIGNLLQNNTLKTAPDAIPLAQRPGILPLTSPTDSTTGNRPYQPTDFNLAFASVIHGDASPPITPLVSDLHAMRLPSFEMLGIGFAHPDRVAPNARRLPLHQFIQSPDEGSHEGAALAGPLSENDNDWHFEQQTIQSPTADSRERQLSYQPPDSMLTPPEDQTPIGWSLPPIRALGIADFVTVPASGEVSHQIRLESSGDGQNTAAILGAPGEAGSDHAIAPQGWLDSAVNAMNITNAPPGDVLKILSHALPTPLIPGHGFPAIINAIRTRLPSPLVWINLLHAVPGKLSLEDVPKSPPTTPGAPFSGEDYFTTKIFDSAAPSADYEVDASPSEHGPYSLAPPSSVNIAIVERYIPPTSSKEFAELFSPSRSSILVDRMVELKPHNGVLVFIYPTKLGAATFMDEYLGPLLDPLLRSIVIVNGLSADFSTSLGQMEAKDKLYSFESMRTNIQRICTTMSATSPEVSERLCGRQASFSVVHSAKHQVDIPRNIWSEWWTKQEKPRVRSTVAKHFRIAQRLPDDAEVSPVTIVQEILDGVSKVRTADLPSHGIEVGVFVIKRNE